MGRSRWAARESGKAAGRPTVAFVRFVGLACALASNVKSSSLDLVLGQVVRCQYSTAIRRPGCSLALVELGSVDYISRLTEWWNVDHSGIGSGR